jgi:hypothetical protein
MVVCGVYTALAQMYKGIFSSKTPLQGTSTHRDHQPAARRACFRARLVGLGKAPECGPDPPSFWPLEGSGLQALKWPMISHWNPTLDGKLTSPASSPTAGVPH